MRPRAVAIAALVAGLVAVAVLWERGERAAPLASASRAHASAEPRPAMDAAPRSVPLPPPDTPLVEVARALEAAAAAGDAVAGCRLAMELRRCERHAQDRAVWIGLARDPACEGFAPGDGMQAWKLLLEAARAGHVPSMVRFTSPGVIRDEKGRGEWDLEALGHYRLHVREFLERAAQAGDATAAERLGFAHLKPGPGDRPIPYDPALGLAYLRALSARVGEHDRVELEARTEAAVAAAKMDAAQLSRAERLAFTVLPAASPTGWQKAPETPANDFGCRL